jgi:hypothetical protein
MLTKNSFYWTKKILNCVVIAGKFILYKNHILKFDEKNNLNKKGKKFWEQLFKYSKHSQLDNFHHLSSRWTRKNFKIIFLIFDILKNWFLTSKCFTKKLFCVFSILNANLHQFLSLFKEILYFFVAWLPNFSNDFDWLKI